MIILKFTFFNYLFNQVKKEIVFEIMSLKFTQNTFVIFHPACQYEWTRSTKK